MKKILFLLLFALIPFLFPAKASAETIHSFDVTVTSHKDGLMDVSEKIDYDFEYGDRHGIYRYIPLFAKVGDLYRISKISNVKVLRDGKNEPFSSSSDAKQLNLKIGNAGKTITGDHKYQIDYTVSNAIGSNFSDFDEVYWNGTGNGWDVDIEFAKLTFNTDFGLKPTKILCFTGVYGSTEHECQIIGSSIKTTSILYSSYGLSGVAVYPVGTFPKSFLSKNPPQTFGEMVGSLIAQNLKYIYLFLNIILPIILIFWYQKHKNKTRFGAPAVNFDIPEVDGQRLPPAEAGIVDNTKLERDDVTATIFDLAIRKYIKLEGTKTVKKLAPDENTQTIIRLKDSEGLNAWETTLYDRLFETGDSVSVKELSSDFYITFQSMETQVFESLKSKGLYIKNPKVQKILIALLGTWAIFTLNIILGITLFYLSKKLNGRTLKGDNVDFKIDGLKLFLQGRGRNYKWQANKFYTVEQMIPYAMALGYIDEFMKQLKILKPDYSPSWYSGYRGSFFVNYALFSTGFSSSITTSAPSSSSGSGGGGFSGGGGGGGGGGSW